MHVVAVILGLAILEYVVIMLLTGQARARFGVRESRKIAIMPGLFRRLQQALEAAGNNKTET